MMSLPTRAWRIAAGLVLSASLCCGCNKTAAPAPAQNAVPAQPGLPTQAQPKLQTMKLWLGAEEMKAELALSPIQQQTGMMFRTNMEENEGMLFAFGMPHRASFWMANTILPLSAAYIDPDGVILEIHDLQPHDTNSVTAGTETIQYVLETRQGWFQRHHIPVGTVIRTERGSLRETFFP